MNILICLGDYKTRQATANSAKADYYLELHLNSASPEAHGVEGWVGTNASSTSKRVMTSMVRLLNQRTGITLRYEGVPQVGGRAEGSVVYTTMPAGLLEVGFGSNKKDLAIIEENIPLIADAILDSLELTLPSCQTLALSIGHVGKKTATKDRGAALVGGGYEADVTLRIASQMVTLASDPSARIAN